MIIISENDIKTINANRELIKQIMNCKMTHIYDNVITNSAWFFYKESEKGKRNSKWIRKDNLQFSQFHKDRDDDQGNYFNHFTIPKKKKDKLTWNTAHGDEWKNNPFTKYINKVKINMFVLILLIIIVLFLFVKYKYGIVRYVIKGLIFIVFIQIFKVDKLMKGGGKLKGFDEVDINSEPIKGSYLFNMCYTSLKNRVKLSN